MGFPGLRSQDLQLSSLRVESLPFVETNIPDTSVKTMNHPAFLSIVTATTGKFTSAWLDRLLSVQGSVEFVFVYPPGLTPPSIDDPRVKIVISSFKGEVMQRLAGLFNATGTYTIALDDDDFIHPDICKIAQQFFEQFPESWVLRLSMSRIFYKDLDLIDAEWVDVPPIATMPCLYERPPEPSAATFHYLRPLPIAPLKNRFNWLLMINPFINRRDQHGPHIENFNNKIWNTSLVQKALPEFSKSMKLWGNLTWIPFWSLDRTLGLFIQAIYFNPKIATIGYRLEGPEQVRYILNGTSPEKKNSRLSRRFYFSADLLLAKHFPSYGYFWNLFFDGLYTTIKQHIKLAWQDIFHRHSPD